MAVVINDFEVVPAEPPRQQSTAAQPGTTNPSPPRQQEIERVVEQQLSRSERVWAH
jgi:hypothetical protein